MWKNYKYVKNSLFIHLVIYDVGPYNLMEMAELHVILLHVEMKGQCFEVCEKSSPVEEVVSTRAP